MQGISKSRRLLIANISSIILLEILHVFSMLTLQRWCR